LAGVLLVWLGRTASGKLPTVVSPPGGYGCLAWGTGTPILLRRLGLAEGMVWQWQIYPNPLCGRRRSNREKKKKGLWVFGFFAPVTVAELLACLRCDRGLLLFLAGRARSYCTLIVFCTFSPRAASPGFFDVKGGTQRLAEGWSCVSKTSGPVCNRPDGGRPKLAGPRRRGGPQ